MRQSIKKVFIIICFSILLLGLTSCTEYHTKNYILNDEEKLYFKSESKYKFHKDAYPNEGEIGLRLDYSNSGLDYLNYSGDSYKYSYSISKCAIISFSIKYMGLGTYNEEGGYYRGYAIYDIEQDIVYLYFSSLPFELHTDSGDVSGEIHWKMTFNDNNEYTIDYNGKNLVEIYENNWSDNIYFGDHPAQKTQRSFIKAMLDCRNITMNYEVKEEKYPVEVPLYNWYNPWGKIIIGVVSAIVFISIIGIIYFLMKQLYN